MHLKIVACLALLASLLAGCATRSISNSGYPSESWYGHKASTNPLYKGELSEFDVLGIDPQATVTTEEIAKAFEQKQGLKLSKGSSIMLIQSGALIPDEPMVKALEKYYSVAVFSGVPTSQGAVNYSMPLRLAAAKGGFEKIVVYWGLLETAQKGLGSKTVSWVPFVGGVIPDQTQEMRVRLKVAVVDVKTGQWDMFSPEPFQDMSTSARYSRESSDQGQVALLKKQSYQAAAEDLVKRYAK
jgi:hypothetical protein